MRFKKFVVFATLVLVVCSQMALGTRGQTELQFPVLPEDAVVLGGEINIAGFDPKIRQGIIFDENIQQIIGNAYGQLDTRYCNGKLYLTLPFDEKNFENENKNSFLLEQLASAIKPVVLLSDEAGFLPLNNLIFYRKNDDKINTSSSLVFYNTDEDRTVFKIDNVKLPVDIISVSRQLILIKDGISNKLYKTGTWTKIVEFSGPFNFDSDIFVTNSIILDINTLDVIADISEYNLETKPRFGGSQIWFNSKYDQKNPYLNIVTRFSRVGQFLGKEEVHLPGVVKEKESFQLVDLHENLALGLILRPYSRTYRVFETRNGEILWETDFKRDSEDYCYFYKSNLLMETIHGTKLIDLKTFKTTRYIDFSKYPQILSSGNNKVLVSSGFDGNRSLKIAYMLDANLQPILYTKTVLPFDLDFCFLHENKIISVSSSPCVESNNINNCKRTTISHSEFGSLVPFKKIVLENINSEDVKEDAFIGNYFLAYGNYGITAYNIDDGSPDYFLKFPEPEQGDMVPEIHLESHFLVVQTRSNQYTNDKRNHLYCFDLESRKMLFDMEFEDKNTKIMAVDNEAIWVSGEKNQYNVLRFAGEPLKFDNVFAYYKNIVYMTKIVYLNGVEKYFLVSHNIKNGVEKEIQSENLPPSPIFYINDIYYSNKGFYSLNSYQHIQQNLGEWLNLQDNDDDKILLQGINFSLDGKRCNGVLTKLSPCPSFSVKRTGKGGGNGKDGAGEVSFEFKNTREDGRDLVLKGEVYLVSWGDDGKAPLFAKLNEPRHKLGPLLPGMSQEITFKLPEPPLLENNQKGEGKYFALVVESNGLMDRDKSVLSEYDKDPRPLFDGTPVALDQQKAIVVTVWGR